MVLNRSSAPRWAALFLCVLLGTWLGIFLQRFGATSVFFANFVDFNIDVRQIDLVMLKFGFHFAMKLNLGTIIGGAFGMWITR